MAVKIRLQRHGAKKRPFYYIVVANSTTTRDGKFIEKLGTYNPTTVPATINLDRDRALYWLNSGAQPTDTADRILSFKGVKYLKHLMRGVKLGLFDQDAAMAKFEKWNAEHELQVAAKQEHHKKTKAAIKAAQQAPIVKVVETPVAEPAVAEAQVEEAPVEEAPATEEAATPETPAAE
jgi:small subunit ribosomal protein S16